MEFYMPFPLFIPFLIKGGIVAAKAIAAKGAGAAVAKTAVVTVKTYGLQATAGAAVTGLVGVGALTWTYERGQIAKKIHRDYKDGNYALAAQRLVQLIKSFHMVDGNDFIDTGRLWIDNGCDIYSSEFRSLVKDVKLISKETKLTYSGA
jgi:hypothetical protein